MRRDSGTGAVRSTLYHAVWEHYHDDPQVNALVYGGIGFWCDGAVLSCRVIADGASRSAPARSSAALPYPTRFP